jgi:hypothetical protein
LITVEATDSPSANASADQIVELAGIDRLRRAAPCDPHLGVVFATDETVDVRRVSADAEVACGRALDEEPRRLAQCGAHFVSLVAPRGEAAFGFQRAGDNLQRTSAGSFITEFTGEGKAAVARFEDIGQGGKACVPRVVDPAGDRSRNSERVKRATGGASSAARRA